jgi:SAM-dependent methyltransferase
MDASDRPATSPSTSSDTAPPGRTTTSGDGAYLEPYREALDRFGPSFEATLWVNPRAQRLRFDVMLEMCDPKGLRIIDAGCGRGDLVVHLARRRRVPGLYVGLDAFETFVAEAQRRRRRRIRNAVFEVSDFVTDESAFEKHRPDLVLFSGSLNTLPRDEALVVVERAFGAARIGVIFNFLSTKHHARFARLDTGPANRYDPSAVLTWATDRTPRVRFRQDYFDGHDATIAMFRTSPEES